ncbi:hypothetical protein FOXG_18781 [Fusarium oxysporum f. sp. lycopersici 4287]|uniref:Uncharacterized protein n=3 Tax=Fusarium oxysporum TaxID=5507 RepID=A0A0J9UPM7_FUSO4|nr:hypothetical protein FOXG_18781 [Fusarium oxysporum f. sp. lycopersici 4287]KNB00883.1 hypothetical protein FOXG_18781 [Fusarium oxysporum f. sp. lycopersici 4287]
MPQQIRSMLELMAAVTTGSGLVNEPAAEDKIIFGSGVSARGEMSEPLQCSVFEMLIKSERPKLSHSRRPADPGGDCWH